MEAEKVYLILFYMRFKVTNKMIKIDIARKPITFVKCDRRIVEFAPSWELLMFYKNKFISWNDYVKKYYQEMRESFKINRQIFYEIASQLDEVELICWCTNKRHQDKKCHRFLIKEILENVRTNM